MKENRFLLTNLKWELNYDEEVKRLHVSEDDIDDFKEIFDKTVSLIKPVYYMGSERVQKNDGHTLTLDGIDFSSRVVCVNLEACEYVYPYVGTSGRAAYEYALSLKDDLFAFWADALCEAALRSASQSFNEYMKEFIGSDSIYYVNPGSVVDWNISQQAPLFELIGDVFENTGIFLEKSFLMRPVKSSSGIIYKSDKHFASCMLCARIGCPNRRAPFDKEMFDREYGE